VTTSIVKQYENLLTFITTYQMA